MFITEQFVRIVHMSVQDRRITKTRKAIYNAFLQLLNQKDYEAIIIVSDNCIKSLNTMSTQWWLMN